jgi:hypothetical protein
VKFVYLYLYVKDKNAKKVADPSFKLFNITERKMSYATLMITLPRVALAYMAVHTCRPHVKHQGHFKRHLNSNATKNVFKTDVKTYEPPLWSSSQSFWLQIQGSRFYEKQRVWNGVLLRITGELLEGKLAAPV